MNTDFVMSINLAIMHSDIRKLDLNLLKALDALLDEGSVTGAARRLALTQPAVSGMLTRLRDHFDDPLFVRARHGMVPTLRARELAGPVKQILADIGGLLTPTRFDPQQARMTYTIAATDYALKAVIVPLMAALKQQAPGIRVAVIPVDSARLAVQFERGDIDLALVTPQTTPEGLHGRELYQEQYVCMLRNGHPALAEGELSLARFCQLEHILVSGHGSFHGVTDDALAAIGRERRVGMAVSSFLVVLEVLRTTDMIAMVPRRLAQQAEDLTLLAPPLAVPGFIKSMAWHERNHRDPAQRWIRSLLVSLCQPSAD